VFSTTVPSGEVIRSSPAAGASIRTRTKVVLITSKGPELLLVPDTSGDTESQARSAIQKGGFVFDSKMLYSDTVDKGRVIDQNPSGGTTLVRGSKITVHISAGPAPVQIPTLAGQPATDAQVALENLGFTVTVSQQFSDTVQAGDVIGTEPSAGAKAPKGSGVTLVVSKGPQSFPMPNVVGMKKEDAIAKLEGLGLQVSVSQLPSNNPPDTVVYQQPAAGATEHHGDTVTIYVTSP
jgi:serine/threonine-protein kinase